MARLVSNSPSIQITIFGNITSSALETLGTSDITSLNNSGLISDDIFNQDNPISNTQFVSTTIAGDATQVVAGEEGTGSSQQIANILQETEIININNTGQSFYQIVTQQPNKFLKTNVDIDGTPNNKTSSKVIIEWNFDNILVKNENLTGDNYVKYSKTLAEEYIKKTNGNAIWANQFDNIANMLGHYNSTGKEILEQTEEKIDAFICSSGTGGTIAGVGKALKEFNKDIKIILADPKGSALYNYIKSKELIMEGSSITEGIGSSRVTANFAEATIDDAYSIDDKDAIPLIFKLIKNEGLNLGTSSGINIAGAIKLGKEIGPGKIIVTILCDLADRYKSKLFNKELLKEKDIPIPEWL